MKSLKRKALSNASALPAILYVRYVSFGKYTHQYISHGAIAMFAEYIKKKKKQQQLDFHGYEIKSVCHFQTNVISVVIDLKDSLSTVYSYCVHSPTSHISNILYLSLLLVTCQRIGKLSGNFSSLQTARSKVSSSVCCSPGGIWIPKEKNGHFSI